MKFLFILVCLIGLDHAGRGIKASDLLQKELTNDYGIDENEIEDQNQSAVDGQDDRTDDEDDDDKRDEERDENEIKDEAQRDAEKENEAGYSSFSFEFSEGSCLCSRFHAEGREWQSGKSSGSSEECMKADGEYCDICIKQSCLNDCSTQRAKDVAMKKMFYKIASHKQWHVPLLNQTINDTLKYFMFDEFAAHHFTIYFLLLGKTLKEKLHPIAMKLFAKEDFTTYQQYLKVAAFFKKGLKLDKPRTSKYFKVPSISYPYFTDLTVNKKFLEDRYFVEMRLSGVNPMAIQRVTFRGKIGTHWGNLRKKLNPSFKWEKAIRKVTGRNLKWSVRMKQLYVVEFPLLEGIPSIQDFFHKFVNPSSKMLKHANPIAIFASEFNRKTKQYEMKVVAIQTDSHKSAPVYTPNDGFNWQLAKYLVQISDLLFSQIYEHLLRTHLRMEPLCISMNRHLPDLHPLHVVLKFHCRGLLSVNSNGLHALLGEGQALHGLFAVGNVGSVTLLKRGFDKMVWNDFALQKSIKERGMENKKKVPYYPYRDDGELLDAVIKDFGTDFVKLFYRNNRAVRNDKELQNFINELSAKGTVPPNNGIGQVKGLPGKFTGRRQLANFISQTLWILVQHSATNNPNGEYASQTAIYPTKLYDNQRAKEKKDVVYMLPGAITASLQARLTFQLGSLHYDTLFDYGNKIQHKGLRNLVRNTYSRLMCEVKTKLDARNAKRFKMGQLTNPYMVPGWITNSISC